MSSAAPGRRTSGGQGRLQWLSGHNKLWSGLSGGTTRQEKLEKDNTHELHSERCGVLPIVVVGIFIAQRILLEG